MNHNNLLSEISIFKDKLFRLALRLVGNETEAEDVVQEVYIKMWRKHSEISTIKNIEAWCVQVTKNLAIDKTRSKHRRTVDIQKSFDLYAEQAAPDKVLEAKDVLQRVHSLIENLPPSQKTILHLRDIEGHSYQEIADLLDIPISSVKTALFRARQFLKKEIDKQNNYGL
ncbi:MAG TPA: RNA polymerase sigma factor [Phaeodactylibacter sp.]|nr:RNA polymerase sigma factor [Phaeodactylibacter sp.]